MVVLLHVIIAFAGLISAAATYVSPSRLRLRVSYALASLTFITGSYLLVGDPAHLVPACIMGLTYFAVVIWAVANARRRLARAEQVI